jgi:hypothetical protein
MAFTQNTRGTGGGGFLRREIVAQHLPDLLNTGRMRNEASRASMPSTLP